MLTRMERRPVRIHTFGQDLPYPTPGEDLAEMVATTMNANCGGRDHGAIYIERAVIDWARRQMGFPDTASGVLVTGTSQATVIALACARPANPLTDW